MIKRIGIPLIRQRLKPKQERKQFSTKEKVLSKHLEIVKKKNSNCPIRLKHAEDCLKTAMESISCNKMLEYIGEFGYNKPYQEINTVISKAMFFGNDAINRENLFNKKKS